MRDAEALARQRLTSEAIRYFAIMLMGLAADIAIALMLRHALAVSVPVAAAASFLIVVAFNYILFEKFLFGRRRLSLSRLARTYASAIGALAVRLLAAWGLSLIVHGSLAEDAAVLVASAGVSFVVNFLILRIFLL